MEQDTNRIRSELLKMSWYMRGGISYTDIMNLSFTERQMISKIIEENLETTQKSRLPFF